MTYSPTSRCLSASYAVICFIILTVVCVLQSESRDMHINRKIIGTGPEWDNITSHENLGCTHSSTITNHSLLITVFINTLHVNDPSYKLGYSNMDIFLTCDHICRLRRKRRLGNIWRKHRQDWKWVMQWLHFINCLWYQWPNLASCSQNNVRMSLFWHH